MNIQHIQLKLFIQNPTRLDLKALIPIFHRWIQAQDSRVLLIDVADYTHVPEGPGVMLIAHEAHYSLDQIEGRLGLLYNRKAVQNGSNQEKIAHAFSELARVAQRLEGEPILKPILSFQLNTLQVILNDRMLAPNTAESGQLLESELKTFFKGIFPNLSFSATRHLDPRERLTFDLKFEENFILEKFILPRA